MIQTTSLFITCSDFATQDFSEGGRAKTRPFSLAFLQAHQATAGGASSCGCRVGGRRRPPPPFWTARASRGQPSGRAGPRRGQADQRAQAPSAGGHPGVGAADPGDAGQRPGPGRGQAPVGTGAAPFAGHLCRWGLFGLAGGLGQGASGPGADCTCRSCPNWPARRDFTACPNGGLWNAPLAGCASRAAWCGTMSRGRIRARNKGSRCNLFEHLNIWHV
jgi:hypothetical protein